MAYKDYYKMTVKELWKALTKLNRDERAFWDDPMTDACGCASDFSDDFDRERRSIVGQLVNRCRFGSKSREKALGLAERWMP